ncbi:MAG: histidine kinase dimerization/phospho-acceptor domain-containing protein, partial [Ardenticatenaceae bacterium]|nr:histidine kinase dimerization/phospho-acceptor domain-containing protein [Ardenticatenaceae bacterium]
MRGNQIRGQLTRSYLLVIVVTVAIILLLFQLIPFTPGDRLAARLALAYGQQLAPLIQDHLNDNPNREETRKLLQAAVSQPEPSPNERQALILQRTILAALQIERVMLLSADGEVLAEGIVTDVDPAGLPADWEDRAIQLETADGASNFLLVQTGLDLSQAGALQPAFWRFTAGAGLFAALIGAGLSWYLVQQITTPLTQLRNAAVKMTEEGKAEPLEVEGENELADLARAFNRMTTTIEQQQTQRRQFVADIAHELRTPLTIMQVNLEGLQDGMQSVDSAGRVISQEIQALTRLIDDL